MLSRDDVIRALNYDPDTGIFTWKNPKSNRVKRGMVAGTPSDRRYIKIGINGTIYRAHRLAWLIVYGDWPAAVIDHINGDPADNRIANLRGATQAQNCLNSRVKSNNTSGYPGVKRSHKKWAATFTSAGKSKWLGTFDTPRDAYSAYLIATEREYGPEFIRPLQGDLSELP